VYIYVLPSNQPTYLIENQRFRILQNSKMGRLKKLPSHANKLITPVQSFVPIAQLLDWVDNLHQSSPLIEAGGPSTFVSVMLTRKNESKAEMVDHL
jgi:hypothetical protein